MLGDRPALTPVESFYQRMLAGDPDEALDQAEALLRDRSLSSYYDEVVVKGLQLAAADCVRGVLDDARLDRVRRAARALIADLAGHDDSNPAPARGTAPNVRTLAEKALPATASPVAAAHPLTAAWQADGAILCVAGRGPLDEVGSSILAQLLGKHDLGSRTATYADVSRERIADLYVSGVLAIAVTYLDIEGSPAHLRTLLRRLHERLPGVPVIIGLWRRTENEQDTPDADQIGGNLREMVIHCRDIAEAGGAADRDLMAAFA